MPSGGNVGASDVVIVAPNAVVSVPPADPARLLDASGVAQGTVENPLVIAGASGNGQPQLDAFGRWRSADPFTLFNSRLTFDSEPLLWDDQQTAGAGTTTTHSANAASVTLAVAAACASRRRGSRTSQASRR